MRKPRIQPKPNIVLNIRGLGARELEKEMNDLEARNYFHDSGLEAEGVMLFRHYQPQPAKDPEEIMELVGKISRRYLAWHRQNGLGNRATKGQVEYFVRSNHFAYPDGSPLASMELRLIHTNVNLILDNRTSPMSQARGSVAYHSSRR
jgi:hypothetical protein